VGQRGRGLHTWGALARATGRAIAFEPCFKKKKEKRKSKKPKQKKIACMGVMVAVSVLFSSEVLLV